MQETCVAIVDPYSSGALLAESLAAQGVRCIAIESSSALPPEMKSKFDPSKFAEIIAHATLPSTLAALREFSPTHLIAGFESGVELAECLSEALGLATNDAALRAARRDKSLMSEAARRHGLRTALQTCSDDTDQLVEWAVRTLDWPVIVKPPKSVASDQVFLCRDRDQVRRAADAILSGTNVLGIPNSAVIVQEFLDGIEYAVDMVSFESHVKLTAIWQYERPDAASEFVAYDAMRLIDYEGVRQEKLRSYACNVLVALGIRNGPSHCELIWQHDGPVLIEVGARMSAGVNAVLSRVCGGICQLDETLKTILAPHEFLQTVDQRPRLRQRAANVFLMPSSPGRTLVQTRHLEKLKLLPTLYSMSVTTQPGEVLSRVAGRVTLISADPHAIDRDMATIRLLERDGLFEVREVESRDNLNKPK